jgi:hypothetical protein
VAQVFRFRVSILVVLAALTALAAVFTFARPGYTAPNESKTIDFSSVHYYSPSVVRRAFARHGIPLHAGDRTGGLTWLSNVRLPFPADSLQVMVAARDGKGSWGSKLQPYDVRFGNVFVTYGGHDERLLERAKAAVAALR